MKTVLYLILSLGTFLFFHHLLDAQIATEINGPNIIPFDLATDQKGNKIVVGSYQNSFENDFDPSEEVFTLYQPDAGPAKLSGFIASYTRQGALNFAIRITDAVINPFVRVQNVTTDEDNNIYVIGSFIGKADFDPGEQVVELQARTVFTPKSFLASYDENGQFRFVQGLESIENILSVGNEVNKILTADAEGNTYLLFQHFNINGIDFDPGPDEVFLAEGVYVISYDKDGGFRFVYSVPLNTRDIGCSEDGTHFITGTVSFDSDFDFDPTEENVVLEDGENSAFFFASYSSSGRLNYVKSLPNLSDRNFVVFPSIIEAGNENDCYISGILSNRVDFDPGSGVTELSVSKFDPDHGDIFLARYNEAGALIFAQVMEDKPAQVAVQFINDMAVNSNGDVYVSGVMVGGPIDFDPSEGALEVATSREDGTMFIAGYNKDGQVLFADAVQEANIEYHSLAIDPKCSYYSIAAIIPVAGTFDFAPGAEVFEVDVARSNNMHVLTINPSGNIPNEECNLIVTDLEEPTVQESRFSIYPNPASDHIVVRAMDGLGASRLAIFNLLGQRVEELEIIAGKGKTEITTADYPEGWYVVKIFDEQGRPQKTASLVISR